MHIINMVNYLNRFKSLPDKKKRLVSLGFLVAIFLALPLFIWAIITQTFLVQKKASTGEPGICWPVNGVITVTPQTNTNSTCHDIQTAVDAAKDWNMKIVIMPGVYNVPGQVIVADKTNITITGQSGIRIGSNSVVLNFAPGGYGFKIVNSSGSLEWMQIGGGSSNGMISVQNSTNFRLGYLKVDSRTSHTIDFMNSSKVSLFNSEVQSSAGAVEVYGSNEVSITNNKIYNAANALRVGNSTTVTIIGNLLTQSRETGLDMYNVNNSTIHHNTIINSNMNNGQYAAVNLMENISQFNFYNNLVVYNFGPGMKYTGNSFTRSIGNNDFWNNNGGNFVNIDNYIGINGNISRDPLINFNDWLNLCLQGDSPALLRSSTGVYDYMGYRGACSNPSPTPVPSCMPRPACLDANPACEIPEPVDGWCTPTPTPRSSCMPYPSCPPGDIQCPIPLIYPSGGWCPSPTPSAIKVYSPNGGERLVSGQDFTIRWGGGTRRNSYLIYLINSQNQQSLIGGASASATSYVWRVNSPISTQTALHKIKIVENYTARTDVSDNYFTIVNSAVTPTPRVGGECQLCGGIAGIRCQEGLTCRMPRQTYPDASGICVKIDGSSVCPGYTPTPSPSSTPNTNPPLCEYTTIEPGSGPYPFSVTLHGGGNAGNGAGLDGYRWDFEGDGQWDTGVILDAVTHTYSSPGTYKPNFQVHNTNNIWSEVCKYPYPIVVRNPNIIGDVNGDGTVNIVDIGIIIDFYRQPSDKYIFADLNNDGIINIVDIGIVVDHYHS